LSGGSDCFAYDAAGGLACEGVALARIAAEVGTPAYVYAAGGMRRRLGVYRKALEGRDALFCYALKANSNLAVIRTLAQEGAGADTVSGGEIERALAAGVAPRRIVFAGIAKSAGGYDNADPRAWLARREGLHARAHAAQLNGYEAFPPFAAAVIVAQAFGDAGQGTIDGLAIAWLVLRVAYGGAYLADAATARSLIWTAALGCVVALFVTAA